MVTGSLLETLASRPNWFDHRRCLSALTALTGGLPTPYGAISADARDDFTGTGLDGRDMAPRVNPHSMKSLTRALFGSQGSARGSGRWYRANLS
jgi:hypothetical protein